MRVDIRDFGPMSHASVQLKPLTIFKGPANSGKSCCKDHLLAGQSNAAT